MYTLSYISTLLLTCWSISVTAAPEGVSKRAPQVTVTVTRRIAVCDATSAFAFSSSPGLSSSSFAANNSSYVPTATSVIGGNSTTEHSTATTPVSSATTSTVGTGSSSVASSSSSPTSTTPIILSISTPTTSRGTTTITDPPPPTTTRATSTTPVPPSTTKSPCIPSPTQAILNPSFELDLDLSGNYSSPWTFTGDAHVQLNVPPFQAALGLHFALLSGGSTSSILLGAGLDPTISTMSQTLNNLIPGVPYTLQYYYNVLQVIPQTICTFTASITDGVVLDSIASSGSYNGQYLVRSVSYTPVSATARLEFRLGCPSSILGISQIVVAVDDVTLTTNGNNGCA